MTDNIEEATELLFEGENKDNVTIKDSTEEYQLVVVTKMKGMVRNQQLGFVKEKNLHRLKSEMKDSFKVHMNFGEDVLMIQHNDDVNKKESWLLYIKEANGIRLGKEPSNDNTNSSTDLPLYPLHSCFIVDCSRTKDQLQPATATCRSTFTTTQ